MIKRCIPRFTVPETSVVEKIPRKKKRSLLHYDDPGDGQLDAEYARFKSSEQPMKANKYLSSVAYIHESQRTWRGICFY